MKSKKKKGFTLVELLAVIAILAIILLIAVPKILGVIERAREDSFKNSVRNVFGAVKLDYTKNGTTEGNVPKLAMNNNYFLTGNWNFDDETGKMTLTEVCDGKYKVGTLSQDGMGDFVVEKDDGTCGFEIVLNGNNPDNVSCSLTDTYIDSGAKYSDIYLTTSDKVDLKICRKLYIKVFLWEYGASRVVNVSNTNTPTLELSETKVIISATNTTFNPSDYVTKATDPCEGDIKSKVTIESNVIADVAGTYQIVYNLFVSVIYLFKRLVFFCRL